MEQNVREKLLNAGVDIESAMERFMGNENLLLRFLREFSKDSNYQLFQEAMEKKQYDDAFKATHTLKGVCGNLSLMRLYEVISREVEFLRNGKYEEAEQMLSEVREEYEKTVTVLATL